MAWRAYNAMLNDPRLLIFDSRSVRSYLERHIRGSICVRVSSDRRTLERAEGPGPPTWSPDCWWGRNVLIVSRSYNTEAQMRKSLQSEAGRKKRRRDVQPELDEDEVIQHLMSEGLVKSLKLVESDSGTDKDAFSLFAKQYPFLVTKSLKAYSASGYPAEIVPRLLYLGDWEHAKAERHLEDLRITHVLTIHTERLKLQNEYVQLFCELADESKADVTQYFDTMYEFVEDARKAKKRVLVHCGAGASRSATLCAAYLMRANGWKAADALKFLKEQRKQVDPNAGFLRSLDQYDKALGLNGVPVSIFEQTPENLVFDIFKEGNLLGSVTFPQKKFLVFGRAETCDVVLDHASISRQHAKLEFVENKGITVLDLGSVHGTFVNNKRLGKSIVQKLVLGDVVTFGASTRRYVLRCAVT